MKTTTATTKNSNPDDVSPVIGLIISILLPTSVLADFSKNARAIADQQGQGSGWKKSPAVAALVAGSWDYEWIIKQPFTRPFHGVPSKKIRIADIHTRMKTEPCEVITATITADLWEKIQLVANHYGLTPADHCRACFGYYAALWRKETLKNPSQRSKPPAQATEPGAKVIPFHPYRAARRLSIPAVS